MTRTRILILTAAILSFQSGHTAEPPECPGIETGFLIRARAERSQRPLAERRIRILEKKKPELLAMPLQNVVDGKKLVPRQETNMTTFPSELTGGPILIRLTGCPIYGVTE